MKYYILWAVFLDPSGSAQIRNELPVSQPMTLQACMWEAIETGRYQVAGVPVLRFECRDAADRRRLKDPNKRPKFTVQ